MDKNTWIEQSMKSIEGMQKATPSAELYDQILTKYSHRENESYKAISWKLAVACVLVLVGLNSFAFMQAMSNDGGPQIEQSSDLYSGSLLAQIDLYE